MGCEKSKTMPVDDRNCQKPRKGHEPHGGGGGGGEGGGGSSAFTDLQVDIIKSTWPLVAEDMAANGVAVFQDIFTTEPALKKLFPFKHLDGHHLAQNSSFRAHAVQFMQAFDMVCDALPNLGQDCPVSRRLMVLGAQHASMAGFDLVYFSVFVKCMHLTWERVLGEEYTEEVKEAWSVLFDFVTDRIREGVILFKQEEEMQCASEKKGY